MRIIFALSIASTLLLGACTTGQPMGGGYGRGRYDISGAEAACIAKGYDQKSYEYLSCYRNQPQVQAYERDGRMNGLSILSANRSPRTYAGRSYPVD